VAATAEDAAVVKRHKEHPAVRAAIQQLDAARAAYVEAIRAVQVAASMNLPKLEERIVALAKAVEAKQPKPRPVTNIGQIAPALAKQKAKAGK